MTSVGDSKEHWIPTIIYGLDTPSFPSGELWGYDPFTLRQRTTYADIRPRRLMPWRRYSEDKELYGSLIVIAGGYCSESDDGNCRKMDIDGCLGMRDGVGERFAEQAIATFIDPDYRVTLLLYVSRDEAAENLVRVREAGFEVIETGDVTPGFASAYALCLGSGKMLRTYQWLEQVWGYEPFFLHASRGPQTRLEKAVMDAAINRKNPDLVQAELLKEIHRNPEVAPEILGEDYMLVGTTSPDGNSILVARSDADISHVHDEFRLIASELGVGLIDAGSLRQPDSEGHFFTDFKLWNHGVNWREYVSTMPEHWRRVI